MGGSIHGGSPNSSSIRFFRMFHPLNQPANGGIPQVPPGDARKQELHSKTGA